MSGNLALSGRLGFGSITAGVPTPNYSIYGGSVPYPIEASTTFQQNVSFRQGLQLVAASYAAYAPAYITFSASKLSGNVGIYVSFYPQTVSAGSFLFPMKSLQSAGSSRPYYSNANGQTVYGEYSENTPFSINGYTGVSAKASFSATELEPISNPGVDFSGLVWYGSYRNSFSQSQTIAYLTMAFTSARIVATASSADSAALEGIADALVQQNELTAAYYGDIMSILNKIYSREGDLNSTQKIANGYILNIFNTLTELNATADNILTLLDTYLYYLEDIATTADDIDAELKKFHTDFNNKLTILISTISTESDDIQAKMEEIYQLLIAYLDNAMGSAVTPDASQGVTDVGGSLENQEQLESVWTTDMVKQWGDLGISEFSLGADMMAGVLFVSSWFSNFFNATGDFRIVLLMPMILGVVLLLVGRISRSAAGAVRSSKRSGKASDSKEG